MWLFVGNYPDMVYPCYTSMCSSARARIPVSLCKTAILWGRPPNGRGSLGWSTCCWLWHFLSPFGGSEPGDGQGNLVEELEVKGVLKVLKVLCTANYVFVVCVVLTYM